MPLVNPSGLNEDEVRKLIQNELKSATFKGNSDKKKQVFVSHSFKNDDFEQSKILEKSLNQRNIDAYLAEDDKQYGYILSNKIREAIQESIAVVVILTKNSIISPSVNQEVGFAMGLGMTIIPLVSEDVKDQVGVLLTHVEGEYYTDQNFEEKCEFLSENLLKQLTQLEQTTPKNVEGFAEERGDF